MAHKTACGRACAFVFVTATKCRRARSGVLVCDMRAYLVGGEGPGGWVLKGQGEGQTEQM